MGILCSAERIFKEVSRTSYCDEENVSIHKVLLQCLVRVYPFYMMKYDYLSKMFLFLALSFIDILHQVYESLHYTCFHHSHKLIGGYKDPVSPFSFLPSFCPNPRSKVQARSVSEDLIYTQFRDYRSNTLCPATKPDAAKEAFYGGCRLQHARSLDLLTRSILFSSLQLIVIHESSTTRGQFSAYTPVP